MAKIDKTLAETARVLFGEELSPISRYEDWLASRVPRVRMKKSCLTGKPVPTPAHSIFSLVPDGMVAELGMLKHASGLKADVNEEDSFGSMSQKMPKISLYITELAEGENIEVVDSAVYLNLSNAYKIVDVFTSKNVGLGFFNDYNDHAFGIGRSASCSFSIHCYNSKSLTRCFEADFCRNCSDIMFCHNCENVRESLFCCNVKNLRNAIFNKQVSKEEYLRVKKILVEWILSELKKNGRLPIDIYDF